VTEVKHSRVEFGAWWNELNREFPPYKLPADVLSAQADRWYRELNEFTIHALYDAFAAWLRKEDRRPKLAHMRAGCLLYLMRVTAAIEIGRKREVVEIDSNHCICGCGGTRWAAVLFDSSGNPRTEKIEGADGKFYDATRDHVECLVSGRDSIPHGIGDLLGRDSRGIPVWIIRDRAMESAA
jgi:hypothetical protein